MSSLKRILYWTLVFLLIPVLSWAWSGKVISISDGDTISVLQDDHVVKIRLYGIDTPERHQDFGTKSKQFTSNMVFGKIVEVETKDTDRYGRSVALIYIDNQSLNAELVKAGLAWVYTRYCLDRVCDEWKGYEEEARAADKGIWSRPNPVPPWEFRRGTSSRSSRSVDAAEAAGVYHVNIKSKVYTDRAADTITVRTAPLRLCPERQL